MPVRPTPERDGWLALVLVVLLVVAAARAATTWDPCGGAPDPASCERSLLP